MPNIQLVVFDMAGTTVQDKNEVQRCFFEAATSTGLQTNPDRLTAMMGWSKRRVFETLWTEQIEGDRSDYSTSDYSTKVDASFTKFKEILEHHYTTQPVQPTAGCLELFAWLKSQNIKIALTTGFYREVTNIILNRLGWDQGLNDHYLGSPHSLIQASITPSEIFNNEGRPAPFMIQKAMYHLGVSDSKTVINIGDTPSDLESGTNANCFSYGVTNGTHTAEQLAQYPNHGLLASLHELKSYL